MNGGRTAARCLGWVKELFELLLLLLVLCGTFVPLLGTGPQRAGGEVEERSEAPRGESSLEVAEASPLAPASRASLRESTGAPRYLTPGPRPSSPCLVRAPDGPGSLRIPLRC